MQKNIVMQNYNKTSFVQAKLRESFIDIVLLLISVLLTVSLKRFLCCEFGFLPYRGEYLVF